MQSIDRHKKIVSLVKVKGVVSVEDLASEFGTTPQTIRADLRELDATKKLVRIHGGAKLIDGRENMEYEERRQIAARQKIEIGKHAAALIPDNSSLFVNIGTTTEAVCDQLVDHKGLLVITNNINVANKLRVYREIEVVIAGGAVRMTDGGIVGEAAVDFIKQFKVDNAIIGSSAIDQDGALLDFDFREVKVAQAIIENSRNVILAADSTKFERSAPVRIGHLSQVDVFVTDRIAQDSIRKICAESKVELVETDSSTAP
ncbi:MAG: DeoR/GlpR family DNA-binding transcription regulator [Ahrensia sp.]